MRSPVMRWDVFVLLAPLLGGCMDRSPYQTPVYALGGGAAGARALAVDDERLYWTAAQPRGPYGTVMTLPKDGADSAAALFTSTSGADREALPELALDEGWLYWVVRDVAKNGAVVRARGDGSGSPAEVVSGLAGPCGVGLDADSLYYLLVQEPTGPGSGGAVTVCRSPKSQPDGCSTPLATLTLPGDIAAGSRIISPPTSCAFVLRGRVVTFGWRVEVHDGGEAYARMALYRVPVDNPGAMSVQSFGQGELRPVASIVAAGSAVYVASGDYNLYRIEDDGEQTTVLSGYGDATALAAHEDRLYWLNRERDDPNLFYLQRLHAGAKESVGMGALHALAVDAEHAFVADGDEVFAFRH